MYERDKWSWGHAGRYNMVRMERKVVGSMKIAIAGGQGFIGSSMCKGFLEQQHEVYILSRQPERITPMPGVTYIRWMHEGDRPEEQLEGIDTIVNLAGQSLSSGRWTAKRKKTLLESRLSTTKEIVRIIGALKRKPSVLINASAIGYYGISRDRQFTEQDIIGPTDFLSHIVNEWEQEAMKSGIRTVLMRLGVVLGAGEGAFPKMLLPYRLFVGGRLGSGQQPLSWIHIDDVVGAALHCINHSTMQGAVNFTAPQPVTMEQFGRTLAEQLHRPHYFPVPGGLMKLMLGEMSMLLLEGQHVIPEKLLGEHYSFQYADLSRAIQSLVSK